MKAGQPPSTIITPDLLSTILGAVNKTWLQLVLAPLQYTVLNVTGLCSSPPPSMPIIDLDDIGGQLGEAATALRAVSWPYFCECVPGSPDPIPYPPPSGDQPPNWPTAPTFPCDPADLCATIAKIWQEVAGVRQSVAAINELVTLTQRYKVPFAYMRGALHFGLTGEGTFQIPRTVGFHVRVTSSPPAIIRPGNPDYWWDQGWMSISGPDAMIAERRIARQDYTWFPDSCQQATHFNWQLPEGVVIDVRELYAEP